MGLHHGSQQIPGKNTMTYHDNTSTKMEKYHDILRRKNSGNYSTQSKKSMFMNSPGGGGGDDKGWRKF